MNMNDYKNMSPEQIMERFFYRKNPFAVKTSKGFYVPVNRDVTSKDIQKHLIGEHTIGAYNSRSDETCLWCCIDFDSHEYDSIAEKIAADVKKSYGDIDTLFELSESKGSHVWLLFEKPMKTETAYNIVMGIMRDNKLEVGRKSQIDVFPKSPHLTGKKVSWMVRIPRVK